MTTYVHVKNSEVDGVGIPHVGKLSNGDFVSGYDKLPLETLKKEGWLPLNNEVNIDYDPTKSVVVFDGYEIGSDSVNVRWRLEPIPPPPPAPIDYDKNLADALASATTVSEIKQAIIDNFKARSLIKMGS